MSLFCFTKGRSTAMGAYLFSTHCQTLRGLSNMRKGCSYEEEEPTRLIYVVEVVL